MKYFLMLRLLLYLKTIKMAIRNSTRKYDISKNIAAPLVEGAGLPAPLLNAIAFKLENDSRASSLDVAIDAVSVRTFLLLPDPRLGVRFRFKTSLNLL